MDALDDDIDEPLLVALDVWHAEGARYPEPDVREEPDPDPAAELTVYDVVFVPARPVREGDRFARPELQPDETGRLVLPVYTSPAELYSCCGEHQVAVAIWIDELEAAAADAGVHAVAVNMALPEKARHQQPVLDWRKGDR